MFSTYRMWSFTAAVLFDVDFSEFRCAAVFRTSLEMILICMKTKIQEQDILMWMFRTKTRFETEAKGNWKRA